MIYFCFCFRQVKYDFCAIFMNSDRLSLYICLFIYTIKLSNEIKAPLSNQNRGAVFLCFLPAIYPAIAETPPSVLLTILKPLVPPLAISRASSGLEIPAIASCAFTTSSSCLASGWLYHSVMRSDLCPVTLCTCGTVRPSRCSSVFRQGSCYRNI